MRAILFQFKLCSLHEPPLFQKWKKVHLADIIVLHVDQIRFFVKTVMLQWMLLPLDVKNVPTTLALALVMDNCFSLVSRPFEYYVALSCYSIAHCKQVYPLDSFSHVYMLDPEKIKVVKYT